MSSFLMTFRTPALSGFESLVSRNALRLLRPSTFRTYFGVPTGISRITSTHPFLQSARDTSQTSIFKSCKRHFTSSSNENELRHLILESALKKVPQLGWTHEALSEGCIALGYLSTTKGLFQRGPVELVEYFLRKCDREMSERLSQQGALDGLTPREIVSKAIRLRLELSSVHINTLPQAAALLLHPSNAPDSLWKLATLIDEIWHFANDRSTNLDWYLKRGVLAAIYTSTELYMLSDKSPQFRDTWEFLERRLDDATELANLSSKAHLLGSVAITGACSVLQMATEGLRSSISSAMSSQSSSPHQSSSPFPTASPLSPSSPATTTTPSNNTVSINN